MGLYLGDANKENKQVNDVAYQRMTSSIENSREAREGVLALGADTI